MKTKIALSLVAAAPIAGCSSAPRWDLSVFPQQVVYGEDPPPTVAKAETSK